MTLVDDELYAAGFAAGTEDFGRGRLLLTDEEMERLTSEGDDYARGYKAARDAEAARLAGDQ